MGYRHSGSALMMTAEERSAKTGALVGYILMIAGLFTGVFWVIGAIWAMLKKSDARGTQFADHYSNQISIFWWGLLFSVIGGATVFIVVGYFILAVVWFWSVYKLVKGLARLTSNKSYKDF